MSSNGQSPFEEDELRSVGHALLREGRSVRMRLGGYSMWPSMLPGDVGTIVPEPIQDLHQGNVVVFDRGDKWVAHRLVAIDKSPTGIVLTTQGDSIPYPDEPFREDTYRGVVRSVARGGRQFDPRQGLLAWSVMHVGVLVRPMARLAVRMFGLTKAVMRRIGRFI
jgi:hypothetical protein